MSSLKATLPPPNTLIVFEAAGRHLSFSRAAVELNVSRVAVSQQIQALENFLGVQLFDRADRTIRLTDSGVRYHTAISSALRQVGQATIEISSRPANNIVTISATAGFVTYWLLPNFGSFRAQYPDIELRFIVSDLPYLGEKDVDLAVTYSSAPPAEDSILLISQTIAPTCSANYLVDHDTPIDPGDLLGHPLIHLEGPYDRLTRWSTWFTNHGVSMDGTKPNITVNTYTNLVQAALDGQGFALIGPPLMSRFLASRLLVQPIRTDPVRCHGFHLTVARNSAGTPATEAVASWVKGSFVQQMTA
ncbi:LysR family transcriptional regulator [Burkholderia sp. Bp8992]|uniref:LysR substrate-binding domain-containing protein n=1 Tax=unclassified Burkholderia TaxID=2613784 RepID=UPI000F56C700|nr:MULTISPECIES: LysR substrate-binding domain-containing protein [unclassified Burkholderia]RQS17694.1 LysR family transcriptional regulator [Burkholderia sp. Bp8992]